MVFVLFSVLVLLAAALPAAMVFRNLKLFHRARGPESSLQPISVLIPARNEAAGIEEAVRSVLANAEQRDGADNSDSAPANVANFEVLVLDDHSDDATASIVEAIAQQDPRVRLLRSAELPEGWNGKQHACWQLAQAASHDQLLFLDADVRLSKNAIARLQSELAACGADLLSGFPDQVMGTWSERMLIPMMHFILLGYLPLDQMRNSTKPEFGAGCGQMFLTRREAYLASDGHRAIFDSRHDGLKLPRAFRQAGLRSDLFDASDIASVRMYRGVGEVVPGLLKNATEGIANSKLIGIFTGLLLFGCIFPVFSFAHALFYGWPSIDTSRLVATILLGVATVLSFLPRFLIAKRLGHSMLGVLLHPVSVAWFLGLQWFAFFRQALGKDQVAWRGRT